MIIRKKNIKKAIITSCLIGALTLTSTIAYAELGDKPLLPGMTDPDIKTLQTHLKDLGHFTQNNTTTYYGPVTRSAVIDFQTKSNIEIDGFFGPGSFKALKDQVSDVGSNTESSNENNTIIPDKPADTNSSTLIYTMPLTLGSNGEDVRSLQDALKSLGFLKIANTTTYFGQITKEALMDFQSSFNISVDGSAGPSTYRSLNDALNGKIKPSEPNRGDQDKNTTINIINIAKKYLDPKVPYVFGGNSTSGIDCSAYTKLVYQQVNINLPRNSSTQAQVGQEVSMNNLKAGDLIIFSNTYRKGPSHTGIYLGNDEFIHASSSNNGITISKLTDRYYTSHFTFGRRLY